MAAITWLEVEGVRYEGHGDGIQCHTRIGFHSQLPGHTLDNLDVSDSQGRSLGFLSVDFTSGNIHFSPLVPMAELANSELVIGDRSGTHIMGLDELPVVMEGDLLDPEPEFTYQDSYAGPVYEPLMSALPLGCLVSSADETLDAFFGESAGPAALSTVALDDLSVTLSALYLVHGAEPTLMPMLPESVDLSHLL